MRKSKFIMMVCIAMLMQACAGEEDMLGLTGMRDNVP